MHRERVREREAQRGITLLATVTMNNQPLQKVTKSLYIVTHLGQLPFMHIAICGWPGHCRQRPRRNRWCQVLVRGIIWNEGSGRPSLLPWDWSDPNSRMHIDQPTSLCARYALQIRHNGLQIHHNSSWKSHMLFKFGMTHHYVDPGRLAARHGSDRSSEVSYIWQSPGRTTAIRSAWLVNSCRSWRPTIFSACIEYCDMWGHEGSRTVVYQHGIAEQLVSYTDVDWAGDAIDRRST